MDSPQTITLVFMWIYTIQIAYKYYLYIKLLANLIYWLKIHANQKKVDHVRWLQNRTLNICMKNMNLLLIFLPDIQKLIWKLFGIAEFVPLLIYSQIPLFVQKVNSMSVDRMLLLLYCIFYFFSTKPVMLKNEVLKCRLC